MSSTDTKVLPEPENQDRVMGVGTAVVCHAQMPSCAIWMLSAFVKALVQQTHSQSWDAQCCDVECNSIAGW